MAPPRKDPAAAATAWEEYRREALTFARMQEDNGGTGRADTRHPIEAMMVQAERAQSAHRRFTAAFLSDRPVPPQMRPERDRLAVEGASLWCVILLVLTVFGPDLTAAAGSDGFLLIGAALAACGVWAVAFGARLCHHMTGRAGR